MSGENIHPTGHLYYLITLVRQRSKGSALVSHLQKMNLCGFYAIYKLAPHANAVPHEDHRSSITQVTGADSVGNYFTAHK